MFTHIVSFSQVSVSLHGSETNVYIICSIYIIYIIYYCKIRRFALLISSIWKRNFEFQKVIVFGMRNLAIFICGMQNYGVQPTPNKRIKLTRTVSSVSEQQSITFASVRSTILSAGGMLTTIVHLCIQTLVDSRTVETIAFVMFVTWAIVRGNCVVACSVDITIVCGVRCTFVNIWIKCVKIFDNFTWLFFCIFGGRVEDGVHIKMILTFSS